MTLDTHALNAAADGITAVASRIAAHTDDPGAADTADNEVSGGSPAYARKAITWASADGGVADANGTLPVFDIPASTTVAWVSLWNTAGDTRYAKKQLAADEVFGAQGTLSVTAASITITSS